jgi:hypothetical protein
MEGEQQIGELDLNGRKESNKSGSSLGREDGEQQIGDERRRRKGVGVGGGGGRKEEWRRKEVREKEESRDKAASR